MKRGEKVNWYLIALGTEIDMQNVHFHGQTVLAVSIITFLTRVSSLRDMFFVNICFIIVVRL